MQGFALGWFVDAWLEDGSMEHADRIAGVELGGTKAIALVAQAGRVVERLVVPTTDPAQTLGALRMALLDWHGHSPIDALGIASFGPLRLDRTAADFGRMLATPKAGWSDADIAGQLAGGFDVPWRIDTDVNGATLAEWRWGAGQGCGSLCYLTIGTGVGGGIVMDGRPVHGMLHPELGHMRFRRAQGDNFAGACPFHGDCVEGLVSGSALKARFGRPGEDIGDDDPQWSFVAQDLAELVCAILLTVSPHRILIGGSVALGRPFLLPMIRARSVDMLSNYLPHVTADAAQHIMVQPGLGADAGPMGALALGMAALN
ncbi:ROK family protein [Sphingobium sp. AN641]|uniref:ROK family protein n=1 Tax=Sphingobium sp. AN641 TaxID=3133443 RepID=UPI0030C40FCF